jgi:hypothetical protein
MTNPAFGNVERIGFAWPGVGVDKISEVVPAAG